MLFGQLGADRSPLSVLCIGAHCDDIEIGCGGTLRRLIAQERVRHIDWVILSSTPARQEEARGSASRILDLVRTSSLEIREFEDSYFPYSGPLLKRYFSQLAGRVSPDVIFTHHLADRHQDHRTVAELTWNAFRDHLILEYEIPKYDGDLGHPGFFVPLEVAAAEEKIEALLEGFPSQRSRPWFRRETFEALMRIRAIECHAPSGFAEAFHCRKLVMGGR